MHAVTLSATLEGVRAHLVRVEIDAGRGLPGFSIVGLPEAAVRESRVRVTAALRQMGVELNEHVITVNLAPADLRKAGSAFDLAIALGTLAALDRIPAAALHDTLLLGELSLCGELRTVRGVLPALLCAARNHIPRAVVPTGNGGEAAGVQQVQTHATASLAALVERLREGEPLPQAVPPAVAEAPQNSIDLSDVRGQHGARRVLEIAAAGAHNMLMMGPPGSGKTMLARRLPSILPPLSTDESLQVTAIHSVAGMLGEQPRMLRQRPFRAPHHTVSAAGMMGGGSVVTPGEVSLAHCGCLFLDEMLEFKRSAIEALRQPLETGQVTICRARSRATFPARILLIAAVNPCPCGYANDPKRRCQCRPKAVLRYRQRLSGPLIDRIDLHVALPPVSWSALDGDERGEPSKTVRARVLAARAIQQQRVVANINRHATNAHLSRHELDRCAALSPNLREHLKRALETLGLSARAYLKVRRIARTIADLDNAETIGKAHLAEALQCRLFDNMRN